MGILLKTVSLVNISVKRYSPVPEISFFLTSTVTSVNEGSSVTITLDAPNSIDGDIVHYTLSGSATITDIFNVSSPTGAFTVMNNTASVTYQFNADELTEGEENLTLTLTDYPTVFVQLTVNDTSLDTATSHWISDISTGYTSGGTIVHSIDSFSDGAVAFSGTKQPTSNDIATTIVGMIGKSGNVLWELDVNRVTTANYAATPTSVTVSGSHIYACINVNAFGVQGGGLNGYLLKIDRTGAIVWSSEFSSDINTTIRCVKIQSDVFVCGHSFTASSTAADNGRPFVARLNDSDGSSIWINEYATTNYMYASSLDFDSQGNIFIAGPTSTGASILKLLPSGAISQRFTNVSTIAGPDTEHVDLAVDQTNGDIYLSFNTRVFAYSSTFTFRWAKILGTAANTRIDFDQSARKLYVLLKNGTTNSYLAWYRLNNAGTTELSRYISVTGASLVNGDIYFRNSKVYCSGSKSISGVGTGFVLVQPETKEGVYGGYNLGNLGSGLPLNGLANPGGSSQTTTLTSSMVTPTTNRHLHNDFAGWWLCDNTGKMNSSSYSGGQLAKFGNGDLLVSHQTSTNVSVISRISPLGYVLWSKTIGTSIDRTMCAISPDNSVVSLLSTESSNTNPSRCTLLNATTGEPIWSKLVTGGSTERFNSTAITSTNDVFIVGSSSSSGATVTNGAFDIQVIKFAAQDGTVLLKKYISSSAGNDDALACVVDNSDNLYITGPFVYSGASYPSLIKMSSAGDVIWQRTCTNYSSYTPRSLVFNSTDGFLHIGSTNSALGAVHTFDTNGVFKWVNTTSEGGANGASGYAATYSNGFVFTSVVLNLYHQIITKFNAQTGAQVERKGVISPISITGMTFSSDNSYLVTVGGSSKANVHYQEYAKIPTTRLANSSNGLLTSTTVVTATYSTVNSSLTVADGISTIATANYSNWPTAPTQIHTGVYLTPVLNSYNKIVIT